ncbi:hypothetical protein TNCV_5140531 [Trichonephila clavipes]|nr:hypothetical protein TNCV_5140531 [Trichonephila clavipes]
MDGEKLQPLFVTGLEHLKATAGIAPRVVRVLHPLQHVKLRIPMDTNEALGSLASLPNGKEIWILSDSRSAIHSTCPIFKMAHQAGFSRRSLAGVGLSESVRCHGPGLALLTNGGVQQQQHIQLNDRRLTINSHTQ